MGIAIGRTLPPQTDGANECQQLFLAGLESPLRWRVWAPAMIITIAATVAVLSVAVLPAAAEIKRRLDERDNPMQLLKIPTRRNQIEGARAR